MLPFPHACQEAQSVLSKEISLETRTDLNQAPSSTGVLHRPLEASGTCPSRGPLILRGSVPVFPSFHVVSDFSVSTVKSLVLLGDAFTLEETDKIQITLNF